MAGPTSSRSRPGQAALVAGMKPPALVVEDVRRRLARTWADVVLSEHGWHTADPDTSRDAKSYTPTDVAVPTRQEDYDGNGAAGPWPYAFPLGQPSAELLIASFGEVVAFVGDWREWSSQSGLTLRWRERRVHGTQQQLPTHLLVDTVDSAARLTGWQQRLSLARIRASVLLDRYPHLPCPARTLRQVLDHDEVDFDLLCHVADWFVARAASGPVEPMTPRQVPIQGLHAKWLNTRHALVRDLAGVEDLALLPPHPPRLHFTYLDPDYLAAGGRIHDSVTVTDRVRLPYVPRIVVISENKDTAIHFPPLTGGVAVEGAGCGGTTAASIGWLAGADAVFYWGDMDSDGLEILDGFRAAGVPARSLLMDRGAFERWERYGTSVDQHGNPLPPRVPRPTPHLTAHERGLYEDLCSPDWMRHRRIEQERIPLHVALEEVHAALSSPADPLSS